MNRYPTAAGFRAALEARLNAAAREGGRPAGRARKLVAFSRLLARLDETASGQWVLKGGFALELRLADRARATRDVDLDWGASLEEATEAMLSAAALDLGDHFEFQVEQVGAAHEGVGRGVRFRADAFVGGRLFEQLAIDLGFVTDLPASSDELEIPNLLAFADVPGVRVPAAPLEQHLAEKLHAYTRRYGADRDSSRPKDLIDMVLIGELATFEPTRLRHVITGLFDARGTHPVPTILPAPPADWSRPYRTSPCRSASTPTRPPAMRRLRECSTRCSSRRRIKRRSRDQRQAATRVRPCPPAPYRRTECRRRGYTRGYTAPKIVLICRVGSIPTPLRGGKLGRRPVVSGLRPSTRAIPRQPARTASSHARTSPTTRRAHSRSSPSPRRSS